MNDRIQALKECEDVKMLILERDRFASEASRVSMKRLEYNKELYRRFYSRAFKKWEELDEKANRCILELADFGASHAGYYVLILNNSFEAYCLTSEVSSARTCALAMQNRYDFPFVVVIGRVGPDGKAVFVECLNSQTKSLTVVRPAFMEPLPSSPHKESVGFQVTSIPEEQPQVVEEPVLAVEEPIYEEPILSQPLYIPVYPTNMLSPIDSTIAYILEFIQSLQAQIHSLQTMVATLCGGIIAQEHTPRLCMRRRSRSKSNKCKSPTSEHE
jgi:hypothetical protein